MSAPVSIRKFKPEVLSKTMRRLLGEPLIVASSFNVFLDFDLSRKRFISNAAILRSRSTRLPDLELDSVDEIIAATWSDPVSRSTILSANSANSANGYSSTTVKVACMRYGKRCSHIMQNIV